ncbi:hypothetical protein JAAARDRAFT_128206 [Jaapia argillacea MUCL 33604]|uniref:Aquaporin n=1 Tax=Jaapia argillacea MUCL 33604 TaxID=933084 RepID=A0A067PZG4_9AGAM|nr:hypothetical protein JAAARDRAFT_128206 [Jaapia argillacea MUCL 33604]
MNNHHTSGVVHLADVTQRPGFFQVWEKQRHRGAHWFVECVAEFFGVFLYVYGGVGSTAAFVIGGLTSQPAVGSLLQVGIAYAMGIVLALVICASTSGGHFNPCVTITLTIFRGFPIRKVPRYIISQIFGAYIACLLIYVQYKGEIKALEEVLAAKGVLEAVNFTPQGLAGIFGLYAPTGANLGYVFLNEFVSDFVLGMAIWSCLDPTNFFTPPAAVPFVIGFAYAVVIWGYAPVGLAANTARDLGGRLMALTIWGTKASGGTYAAIAALTNIPAMILAATCYEFFFTDSSRGTHFSSST